MLGVEPLVARPKEDMREQGQDLIRPVAAEDLLRVKPEPAGDRFPKSAP